MSSLLVTKLISSVVHPSNEDGCDGNGGVEVVVVVMLFVMMTEVRTTVDVLLLVKILVLVLVFRHLSHLLDDLTIMVSLVAVYQFERVHLSDQNIKFLDKQDRIFLLRLAENVGSGQECIIHKRRPGLWGFPQSQELFPQ